MSDIEFRNVAKKIAIQFAGLMNVTTAEQRKNMVRSIEEDIEELDFIISGVEERARLEPRHLEEARRLRRERDQIFAELNKYRSEASAQRWQSAQAIDQEYQSRAAIDNSVQSQLQLGTDILERGSETLVRTRNLALETEQVGVDTAAELGVQREQLERSRDRLGETNAEISLSTRIIQRLRCSALQSRMLLLGIIAVEILILGGVITIKILL